MIPLRDENPTRRLPLVTLALLTINVAVFIYELTLMASSTTAFQRFIESYAFVPARVFASPLSPWGYITLFTSMFMHAGLLHIGGNMLYLWIFGNNVEDELGRLRFLLFYLVSGVAAAALQGFFGGDPTIPTLGASGAIGGVLGAYVLLFPKSRVLVAIIIIFFIELASVPAYFVIGFWFILQLANGVLSLDPNVGQGGVAYLAHVGGFAAGLVMAVPTVLGRRKARFRAWG